MSKSTINFNIQVPADGEMPEQGPVTTLNQLELASPPRTPSHLNHTTGNLLSSPDQNIIEIEGHKITELQSDIGAMELIRENGYGSLTIFTKANEHHQAGDFIYDAKELPHGQESFSYKVQSPEGTLRLKAIFEMIPPGP